MNLVTLTAMSQLGVNNWQVFKHDSIESFQEEQFGLTVYNANIKDPEDAQGSEHFVHQRQRSAQQLKAKRAVTLPRQNTMATSVSRKRSATNGAVRIGRRSKREQAQH